MFAKAALALSPLFALGAAPPAPDAARNFPASALAKSCEQRDGWADPAPPAHVFGNVWYVGTCGITALLVTSPQGHVLIDGGVPGAAPLVAGNIVRLGFRLRDVRWIVSSHEHFDHAGAIAELKRLTEAKLATMAVSAKVLAEGKPHPDDPQLARLPAMPPVTSERVLRDGETLAIGSLRLTAHATPAHSPGSTSWTWRSCEGRTCYAVAYADSATTISADGYRFTDHPGYVAQVRRGLAALAALPCDLIVTPHPAASALFERFAGQHPLAVPGACRAYAQAAQTRFADRLASETATK